MVLYRVRTVTPSEHGAERAAQGQRREREMTCARERAKKKSKKGETTAVLSPTTHLRVPLNYAGCNRAHLVSRRSSSGLLGTAGGCRHDAGGRVDGEKEGEWEKKTCGVMAGGGHEERVLWRRNYVLRRNQV